MFIIMEERYEKVIPFIKKINEWINTELLYYATMPETPMCMGLQNKEMHIYQIQMTNINDNNNHNNKQLKIFGFHWCV